MGGDHRGVARRRAALSQNVETRGGPIQVLTVPWLNRQMLLTKDDLIQHVWHGRIVSDTTITTIFTGLPPKKRASMNAVTTASR